MATLVGALTGRVTWLSIGQDAHVTYRFDGDWSDAGKALFYKAFDNYSAVCNLTFEEVSEGGEIVEHIVTGAELDDILGTPTYNAWHEPPGGADGLFGDAASDGLYAADDIYWSSLGAGSHADWIVLHELGHAMGLEHPHSTWHGSGLFPGVRANKSGDAGTAGLNTIFNTVMSYKHPGLADGWTEGGVGGLMALDIAALQKLYGANTATGAGDDVYVLGDDELYWHSIWDAGGWDEIVFEGDGACVIDLRPAHLQAKAGGGGYRSVGDGENITIAAGVTIEAATGGDGNDVLRPNGAANVLTGGEGADRFDFEHWKHARGDFITDMQTGLDKLDLRTIDAMKHDPGNDKFKWIGAKKFHHVEGELRRTFDGDHYHLQGDVNGDGRPDFDITVAGYFNKGDVLL